MEHFMAQKCKTAKIAQNLLNFSKNFYDDRRS